MNSLKIKILGLTIGITVLAVLLACATPTFPSGSLVATRKSVQSRIAAGDLA